MAVDLPFFSLSWVTRFHWFLISYGFGRISIFRTWLSLCWWQAPPIFSLCVYRATLRYVQKTPSAIMISHVESYAQPPDTNASALFAPDAFSTHPAAYAFWTSQTDDTPYFQSWKTQHGIELSTRCPPGEPLLLRNSPSSFKTETNLEFLDAVFTMFTAHAIPAHHWPICAVNFSSVVVSLNDITGWSMITSPRWWAALNLQ